MQAAALFCGDRQTRPTASPPRPTTLLVPRSDGWARGQGPPHTLLIFTMSSSPAGGLAAVSVVASCTLGDGAPHFWLPGRKQPMRKMDIMPPAGGGSWRGSCGVRARASRPEPWRPPDPHQPCDASPFGSPKLSEFGVITLNAGLKGAE